METKHTRGPWKSLHWNQVGSIDIAPMFTQYRINDEPKNALARCYPRQQAPSAEDGYANVEECEANARLIAAAPDMLAQLQAVLIRLDMEPVDSCFPCSAMRETIRETIANALPL
jgi:hypothetical protein